MKALQIALINVKYAKLLCIYFILIPVSINAQEIENYEADYYNKTGTILSINLWSYYSIGFGYGYNIGEFKTAYHHFFGHNYGLLLEYRALKEMHLRVYGNLYGGSGAMHLGLSGIEFTNFEEVTSGVSPEIGLGFPGFSIFYRYNFYIKKHYNCHEVVLLIYPINKILGKK